MVREGLNPSKPCSIAAAGTPTRAAMPAPIADPRNAVTAAIREHIAMPMRTSTLEIEYASDYLLEAAMNGCISIKENEDIPGNNVVCKETKIREMVREKRFLFASK